MDNSLVRFCSHITIEPTLTIEQPPGQNFICLNISESEFHRLSYKSLTHMFYIKKVEFDLNSKQIC